MTSEVERSLGPLKHTIKVALRSRHGGQGMPPRALVDVANRDPSVGRSPLKTSSGLCGRMLGDGRVERRRERFGPVNGMGERLKLVEPVPIMATTSRLGGSG